LAGVRPDRGVVIPVVHESRHMDPEHGNCLHLVMSFSDAALADCQACSQDGDTIVLMDTAVIHLTGRPLLISTSTGVAVRCLDADVRAHGLGVVVQELDMTCVDDSGLVELVRKHKHCLSWK
jgi:sulfur relay protein TusB/DsrH